jgi:hypothetical protein
LPVAVTLDTDIAVTQEARSGHANREPGVNQFECVVPILNVRNFAASMDYYLNKLGFTRKWDWGTPPTFGCVSRGNVEIFLDALHEEYRKSGAVIRLEPTNMPWGTREMNVEDPDGHRFRMGSEATGPADQEGLKRFREMEQRRH